jgi:hypothetical protein
MSVVAQGSGTKTACLGTFTVTIASPAVFSYTAHGLVQGDKVTFSTTGALPTGLTAGTTYFVQTAGLTADAFRVSTTVGGSDVNTSGSQSGTHSIVSEMALLDIAVAGVYTLHVDTVNLASLDVVEFRCYQMILTGGTRRGAMFQSFSDAQPTDDLIKLFVPIANELTDTAALRFTLKQTRGTSRSFPWKVLAY